jgi:septum formation protein
MAAPRIILASASPRRGELLQQIGLAFRQQHADIDETPRSGETAADFVQRMALEKARAVHATDTSGLPVLGADTEVVLDGQPLGKPADAEAARGMLQRLSGRAHEVLSAVALLDGRETVVLSRSRVWFKQLEAGEIDAYWASGEPRDKAGGYGIQGLGAVFIERLEGSYSGVMGLPLFETARLLHDSGIQLLEHAS